jgi:transcriptional regulator with XRE-family HTH domain
VVAAETAIIERRVRCTVTALRRRVFDRLGELGLTSEDLAQRMGVARPRVSLLIHSEELTAEMFERLTEALEVTADWWQRPIFKPTGGDPAGAMVARVKEISRKS